MQVTNMVNGVDVDRLAGTIAHISDDPTLARFQFRAGNQWIDGGLNRTTIKGFFGAGQEDTSRTETFVLDTDEPPVLLGENRAPNAGEYVLHALAACLTGTIVYHAAARGILLDRLRGGALVQRGYADLLEWADRMRLRTATRGMSRRFLRYPIGEEHPPCTAMVADQVELARRQPRIGDDRPGIDPARRQQQRRERDAVFADDHDPVTGPDA